MTIPFRLFVALAATALLGSCAHKPPMIRTTTTAGSARAFGSAPGPSGPLTTTETPFESETHKSFGKAAENLFAP